MAFSQTAIDIFFSYENFSSLKRWLIRIIEKENYLLGEITIVFTTDEYLLSLNRDFLNHDYYTDVLTFDYSSGQTVSGDILVSIERVRDNAIKYNVEFYRELDRVILHGVLHLLGYGDSGSEEIQIIRKLEDNYLEDR